MSQIRSKLPSLYNPATQSPEEVVSNFVIRVNEFNELMSVIRSDAMENPPQHYMIQGQRGYGKSTLLLRLKIEIESDPDLQHWLIPVMFDEEQYAIRNLAGLWEEVVEILADQEQSFSAISEKVEVLRDNDSGEEEIYGLITEELKRIGKKLVLLLDNFGELIRKFSRKENQRLREILITSNHLRLIGASSAILEFYYSYKEPFFDFFKVITLDELDRDETIMLLRKLGETYKAEEIDKIIDEQPERIDALRRLAGGVPRTMVLLFEIFVDDMDGNSIKDLEMTLDRVTPLYKHRLDSLSTQQQAIIDAIAQAWDAVSTKEIAAKVRMPSKSVSSQLNQLEKNQIIRKIPTSTKNHLYQISERFFNIYYLMRLGKRRNRNRVLWLVKFFEICCGPTEIIERAKRHIKAMQGGQLYDKHAFYVTQALAGTSISYEQLDLQHELLEETRKCLSAKQSELVSDLEPSHKEVLTQAAELVKAGDLKGAQRKLERDGFPSGTVNFVLGNLLREENDFQGAAKYYAMAVDKGHASAMNNLALLYKNEFKDFENAIKYYAMAVDKGHARAMNNLANLYFVLKRNKPEALGLQKRAYENSQNENHALGYLTVLLWNDEIQEAMNVYESAFGSEEAQKEVNPHIANSLLMFIAKKQYGFVYRLFQENKHDLRDKYKPVYYAHLSLMGEKYSDELKKMGDEVKESVQDVLKEVSNFEDEFAQG